MFRKMLGVLTAVGAALLLVGVAWASSDGGDDQSSGSAATSATADSSSSVSATSGTSGTSVDDDTSTSIAASTSSSVDDDRTSISLVDASTSTTIDFTTSTSVDDRSTGSTIDDHSTVPITSEPRSHDVNGAGSVSIQVVAGKLVLLDAEAAAGWSMEVDEADARDIKVEFENGDSDAEFEAKIRDGELRVEIERD